MLESFTTGKFTYKKIPVEEQKSRGILGRLVGIIADTDSATRNGRHYSLELWKKVFEDPVMKEKIANRCVFSELGHPEDREEIDMSKVCACLAEQPKLGNDGKIYGVFDILDTNNGRILKTLCDYGTTVGVSSRGTGDLITDDNGDEAVDPDTYNCECWDIVLVPAVESARLKYVTEALDTKKYNKTLRQKLTEEINNASEADQKIMKEALTSLDINLNESRILTEPGTDGKQEEHEVIDTLVDTKGNNHFKLDNGKWVEEKDVAAIESDGTEHIEKVKHTTKQPEEDQQASDINIEPEDTITEEEENNGKFVLRNFDKVFKGLNELGATNEDLQDCYDKMQSKQEALKAEENKSLVEDNDESENDEIIDIEQEEEPAAYEALWFTDPDKEGDYETAEFATEDQLMKFYNDHKDKDGYYGWWLTARDEDWNVVKEFKLDMTKEEGFDSIDENKECTNESCADKEVVEKEAGNVRELKELQEALVKTNKLESDNLALQEKLSVCDTKVKKLGEELAKYREVAIKLSDKAKLADELNENLADAKKKLNSRSLTLRESLAKNKELTDKLNSAIEELKVVNESIESTAKKLEEAENKAITSDLAMRKYKKALIESRNKYIEAKAEAYNISVDEIKASLKESFSYSAIDSICEKLLNQRENLRKLPFMLNESTKIGIKSSSNEYINRRTGIDTSDDDISGLTQLL